MQKNLVIVESPAKAKTIQNYLGDDYKVMSSYGHIRDLKKKNFGIDLDTFQPEYEIPKDKASIVKELKAAASKAENVWLASDEDREGEAISWHLAEVLNLPIQDARRIVFHEITKPAILNAIKNPRAIDINLVDAQQARRVLDRIVGFKLSPVLWRKVKPSLSAGRVQSVAVKLIVEREREIQKFKSESNFRVTAEFNINGSTFRAELNRRFPTADKAQRQRLQDFRHNRTPAKTHAGTAVHNFDAATGGRAKIRFPRIAHNEPGTTTLRVGTHYIYAYRLGKPLFPVR